MPGFEITDYDEDNPAEYTFSVSRPLAIDLNHLEAVPVEGHRYVIRYEWSDSATPPTLLKTQRYYEKLAAAAGYVMEKSGAVGNVTETFHLEKQGRQIWVFLNPSVRVNMLTVVESRTATPPPLAVIPPSTIVAPAPQSEIALTPAAITAPVPTPAPEPTPAPGPESPPATTEDPLATILLKDGRVILPLSFLPGKPDLDDDSQPVIDRVVAILKLHPDLDVTIEGHTDLTGDEQYNLLLSKQRAQAVRTLLIAGHISRHRLTAVGLGGTQPVADEGTAVGREKNRRIELVVQTGSTSKEPSQKDATQEGASPPMEPVGSSSFHSTAPDGVNYYPKPAAAPAIPPAGLSH